MQRKISLACELLYWDNKYKARTNKILKYIRRE